MRYKTWGGGLHKVQMGVITIQIIELKVEKREGQNQIL